MPQHLLIIVLVFDKHTVSHGKSFAGLYLCYWYCAYAQTLGNTMNNIIFGSCLVHMLNVGYRSNFNVGRISYIYI